MADTRLPDVVPAKDLAAVKETGELMLSGVAGQGHTLSCDSDVSGVGGGGGREPWHITILHQDNPGDTPIVQIWPDTGSSPDSPAHPLGEEEEEDEVSRLGIEHRSASQLSDSGIDSQLASPTVSSVDGYNKLQEQSRFVLDLSATHLSVPSRLRPGSLLQSGPDSKQQQPPPPPKEDEPADVENSIAIQRTGNDPSAVPSSSGFLPQKRHHRNFLPVDYSLDGWQSRSENFQKIRSLPSESEQQMEMEENARTTASWSDSTSTPISKPSPQICVHRDISQRNSDRCFDGQSIVSERSGGSYDSDESSHFLADPETDPGSYSSSRKPSFSSVRSESGTAENGDRRMGAQHNLSSRQQSMGMLSRSSSRSTFLSVPSRVPNSLWLSSASEQLHTTDNNKQSRLQPSLQSQLGSMSSLMASHLSLSNPYLRLCLTEGGINDAMLVSMATADETGRYAVDMFDDPYYDAAAAAAIQLSLTQRLAFPQLVESDPEAGNSKLNSRYQQRNELPREESSLNFFAKIITFLVLVFVIVLVVGVLVKISHPPR